MTCLDQLEANFGLAIPNIRLSRENAIKKKAELRDALGDVVADPDPDLGLIVSGSLAREEWTSGSDIDWSLLVDGGVHSSHLETAKRIERLFDAKKWKKPNPNGAFGNLVISHNLVHQIGGNSDTNSNTTQRILLLLESASIGDDQVRNRITKAILERYLEQDTHFNPKKTPRVPRFLINDMVRYWRTMAVDYANKHQADAGRKFAIRNIKLRMSRKLIFVSGLLMVFACHLDPPNVPSTEISVADADEDGPSIIPYIKHLAEYVEQTPLDVLAGACLRYGVGADVVRDLFESYDGFLAKLDNDSVRRRLEEIDYIQSKTDADFLHLREVSHRFQSGLTKLFFGSNEPLRNLTQEYAVF